MDFAGEVVTVAILLTIVFKLFLLFTITSFVCDNLFIYVHINDITNTVKAMRSIYIYRERYRDEYLYSQ